MQCKVDTTGFSRMKLLVLHGWAQSGSELARVAGQAGGKLKKASLAKKLKDELDCDLVCVDAPHTLPVTTTVEIDGLTVALEEQSLKEERAWFFYSKDDARDCMLEGTYMAPGFLADVDREYHGWEQSVEELAAVWQREGPFDGVLGFSQGAVMAHILCWLGDAGRQRDNKQSCEPWSALKFVIFCAGFPSKLVQMREDMHGRDRSQLVLPSLHISGEKDKNVPKVHQHALCECFAGSELWEHGHDRGHVLPQTAADRNRIVEFIKNVMQVHR